VELEPRGYKKISPTLINKGVDIPNPLTLDIGEEVDLERISGRVSNLSGLPHLRVKNRDRIRRQNRP
jgi:hypothetical protein